MKKVFFLLRGCSAITRWSLISFTWLLLADDLSAQKIPISVNHVTGTPVVTIPLYEIKSGGISVPITLVHSGQGVKADDVEQTAGMNFMLQAGGSISREVRGLPDDYNQGGITGWLHNSNGTSIENFQIANDGNATTIIDETQDINYIETNFPVLSDTEPDIFYVSAPGLSCRLVFDKDQVLRTIPYQDVQVTYNSTGTQGITSFTIVNDQGVQYQFDMKETVIRTTVSDNPGAIQYFKNDFIRYQNGISYAGEWKLTTITDASGNFIDFLYVDAFNRDSNDSLHTIHGGAGGTHTRQLQYQIKEKQTHTVPGMMIYGNRSIPATTWQRASFHYRRNDSTAMRLIDSIALPGQALHFGYRMANGEIAYNRRFLSSVQHTGINCANPTTIRFEYFGTTGGNIIIADSISKQVDYWGYYNASGSTALNPLTYVNPSNPLLDRYRGMLTGGNPAYTVTLNGASRTTNSAVVINGALRKISYPDGGTAEFAYEPNDYYDAVAGMVVQGGGIRIKEIKEADDVDTANNQVRTFTYKDPATGLSSGKPIAMPLYAFTTPSASGGTLSDRWSYSTIRFERNQSVDDNSILYSYVKESRPGAGSTLYEFTNPAMDGDASAIPDWVPTPVYYARRNASTYMGLVTNSKDTYPFPPSINYDFERGLLKKLTNYNEDNEVVRESVFTYQRTGAPMVTSALKFENNESLLSYAKYKIYTSAGNLLTEETQNLYDPASGQVQTSTVRYSYTGTSHKLPTKVETTNSDGTVTQNHIKYTKDYTVPSGADPRAGAIKQLQLLNINVPVEQYTQVTSNGIVKTTAASLVTFAAFNTSGTVRYRPAQELTLASAGGLSDFRPSSIIAGTWTQDGRFVLKNTYTSYDDRGFPLITENPQRQRKTILTDGKSQQPVAVFTNAELAEIAFNDFDSDLRPGPGFEKADETYTYSTDFRTGGRSLSLAAASILRKTITKSPQADDYIFSVWIKAAQAANLTVSIVGTGQSYTMPYSGTGWKYYELTIPVGNVPSVFTLEFQSSKAVLLDDVLLYPGSAEVHTTAYGTEMFLKTAETNTNGRSSYYSYDDYGRLLYVYDQDRNIIQRNTYIEKEHYGQFDAMKLGGNGSVYTQEPVSFQTSTYCIARNDGSRYIWNFGDGTAVDTTDTGSSPAHAYLLAGSFTVTLRVQSPIFGEKTITKTIQVKPQTIYLKIQSNVSSGYINGIQLYQNDQLKYSIPGTINTPYPILQGNYVVKINYHGHSFFQSIKIHVDGGFSSCSAVPKTSGSINMIGNFTNGSVTVTANPDACGLK